MSDPPYQQERQSLVILVNARSTTTPTRPTSAEAETIRADMKIGTGFKPEPIAIPVAPGASCMDLPLSAAGGSCDLLGTLDSVGHQCSVGAGSSSDPKAVARQQSFDQLSASLANSEIQPDELQMLHAIGHGSSGNVSQVLHVPSASVLAVVTSQ